MLSAICLQVLRFYQTYMGARDFHDVASDFELSYGDYYRTYEAEQICNL